jgi:hypothetical protein
VFVVAAVVVVAVDIVDGRCFVSVSVHVCVICVCVFVLFQMEVSENGFTSKWLV